MQQTAHAQFRRRAPGAANLIKGPRTICAGNPTQEGKGGSALQNNFLPVRTPYPQVCALFLIVSCVLQQEFTRLSARVVQRLPARQGASCNRKFTRLPARQGVHSSLSATESVSQCVSQQEVHPSPSATRSSLVSQRDRERLPVRLATGSSPVSQRDKEFTRLSARQRVVQRLRSVSQQEVHPSPSATRSSSSATGSVSQQEVHSSLSASSASPSATGSSASSEGTLSGSSPARQGIHSSLSAIEVSQRDREQASRAA